MSKSREPHLKILNGSLLSVTGINFLNVLSDYAKNDKITELEVKLFLKKNYPGADTPQNLSKDDKIHLALLNWYYDQKLAEHEELARDNEVKFGCCNPTSTPYDRPFRSRFIRDLFPRPDQLQFCSDVVGYFPKD